MAVNGAEVAMEIKASLEKKLANIMESSEKKLADTLGEIKALRDVVRGKDEKLTDLTAKLKKSKKSNHSLKRSVKEEKEKTEQAIKDLAAALEAEEEAIERARSAEEAAQSVAERAVATYKESEAYADELVEADKFSYRLGSMDVFNKIQERYPDIDMSKLKPNFGEAEGEDSKNSSSTEADV